MTLGFIEFPWQAGQSEPNRSTNDAQELRAPQKAEASGQAV